jgi:integrase
MEKQAAKAYIAKLKEQLANCKVRHANENAQHKRELDNLKSDVALQKMPGAKNNARIRVESKKQQMANRKIMQTNEIEAIKSQIENYKRYC